MKSFFYSKTFPFWLFTFSAIFILIVSQLIQDGVFMDGMLYISVGKNLAEGLGTFWEPHFSKTSMSIFREQPPLYFGLIAFFYKLFGGGIYTERIFCFVFMSFTAFYIHKIWKVIFLSKPDISKNSWIPILFWVSIPVIFWSYSNHVEETVMALFATISVYYLSKALYLKKNIFFNIILAGIFIFLSSLTKGIQGVFPITGILFFWLFNNKNFSFKENIKYCAVLAITPAIIYVFLIVNNHHIYEVFKLYFENRLGKTFNESVHNTTDNRFELGIRLFTELIPMFLLIAIIYLTGRKSPPNINQANYKKEIFWFLAIGLSGSLPLMITLEQRGFYLVTALPMFAIAGALFVANKMEYLVNKINTAGKIFKLFKIVSTLLFTFSVLFTASKIGSFKRDKELLTDIYNFGKIIPHGEIVSIPVEMWNNWNLQTYLIRHFYISCEMSTNRHYFLLRKDLPKDLVPENYEPYPLNSLYLDMYVLKK